MKQFTIVLMAFSLIFSVSCSNQKSNSDKSNANGNEIIVKEVLQANSYTYLLCDENGKEIWVAAPKMVAQVGAKYFYDGALEMQNFESKDLNRVFDKVYFVEKVTTTSHADHNVASPHMENPHSAGRKMMPKQSEISLSPMEGTLTLDELFKQKSKLKNKPVKVYGIVVKVNKEIMNRDWIHIQDGTGSSGNHDLTITSTNFNYNIGDTLVCSGKLILEKDFGHGYKYDLIIEEGNFTKE